MSNILVEVHHLDGGVFISVTDTVKILKQGTTDYNNYKEAFERRHPDSDKDLSKMTYVLDLDEYTLPIFEGEKALVYYNNHTISVNEDH